MKIHNWDDVVFTRYLNRGGVHRVAVVGPGEGVMAFYLTQNMDRFSSEAFSEMDDNTTPASGSTRRELEGKMGELGKIVLRLLDGEGHGEILRDYRDITDNGNNDLDGSYYFSRVDGPEGDKDHLWLMQNKRTFHLTEDKFL